MIKSQFWIYLEKEVFIISSVATHPDSIEKKNDTEETSETTFYGTLQMGSLVITLSYLEFITSSR